MFQARYRSNLHFHRVRVQRGAASGYVAGRVAAEPLKKATSTAIMQNLRPEPRNQEKYFPRPRDEQPLLLSSSRNPFLECHHASKQENKNCDVLCVKLHFPPFPPRTNRKTRCCSLEAEGITGFSETVTPLSSFYAIIDPILYSFT